MLLDVPRAKARTVTNWYLDKLKKDLRLRTDYALAHKLGLAPTAISNYRAGRSQFDDYMAARVAEILRLNPLEVIATINYERDRRPEARMYWRELVRRLTGTVLPTLVAIILTALVFGDSAYSLSDLRYVAEFPLLYIMRSQGADGGRWKQSLTAKTLTCRSLTRPIGRILESVACFVGRIFHRIAGLLHGIVDVLAGSLRTAFLFARRDAHGRQQHGRYCTVYFIHQSLPPISRTFRPSAAATRKFVH